MYFPCQEHIADREASVHARKTFNLFLDLFWRNFFLKKSSLFLSVFSLKCRLTHATAGMSYFALIVNVFSRAWKCDKLQPLQGRTQDVMTTLFGRAPPSEIGGDEEDHYKEFGVKGSSFASGIWCLYGVFPSLIGQCISETYPRRTATRSMHVT